MSTAFFNQEQKNRQFEARKRLERKLNRNKKIRETQQKKAMESSADTPPKKADQDNHQKNDPQHGRGPTDRIVIL